MGHTQLQAGDVLGVTRATIQNWEHEITPIPIAVGLACRLLLRRWKQRPEFGPVTLVYTNFPLPGVSSISPDGLSLTCQRCINNADALIRINELCGNPSFFNPMIFDELGIGVWSGLELMEECQRYCSTATRRGPDTPKIAPEHR
jgi:hypothetical protein